MAIAKKTDPCVQLGGVARQGMTQIDKNERQGLRRVRGVPIQLFSLVLRGFVLELWRGFSH